MANIWGVKHNVLIVSVIRMKIVENEKGAIIPIDFIINLTVDLYDECENQMKLR